MKNDPSVLPSDAYYPSLSAPSAPPMAQLVSHDLDDAAHQQSLLQPLLATEPSRVAFVYEAPSFADDERGDSCCGAICKLFFFHLMNALLSVVAFLVVAIGIVVSVALLPLCLCGAVTCCMVLDMVRFFVQLDVQLHNSISSSKDKVFTSSLDRLAYNRYQGERLAPNVMYLSTRSIVVTLYFLTIKLLMGAISLVMFVLGLALTCVCLFVVAYPLMYMTAHLSRAAMRTFCCDHFSTSDYGKLDVRFDVDVRTDAERQHGWRHA